MRRSAAPSFRNVKKARFLPQVIKSISINKENQFCSVSELNTTNVICEISNSVRDSSTVEDTTEETKIAPEKVRTNEDVLDIIFEVDSATTGNENCNIICPAKENIDNSVKSCKISPKWKPSKGSNSIVSPRSENNSECNKSLSSCIFCIKDVGEASLFNVVWCKRSGKKHKTWEGDGLLIVRSRSAVLKDLNGKTLDKGVGYKLKETESLEEGSKFFIGGKECEIQCKISEEECQSGKFCNCCSTTNVNAESPKKQPIKPIVPTHKSSKKFYPPVSVNFKSELNNGNGRDPYFTEENAFILPSPTVEQQTTFNSDGKPVVDVHIDSFLNKQLRSHQKEGISFLYKCIMGFQHELGQGSILADEMGLGKTLQCIALIWILYKRGPYGGLPVLKSVIIITPSSLVTNWQNEFHKWLGKARLPIFAVSQKNTVKDFVKCIKPVLIISYEMFLRSSELLSSVPFDLVICDEGHRIKNLNIKISNVINCLQTTRRILLTGTPIQNDLAEFFSIVDFVNPGALGTLQYFRKTFERPIVESRNQECSESEKEYGEEKSEELANLTKMFMLRRTQEVINQYLPPKTETVIFCRPSEIQVNLYNHLLRSREFVDILSAATFDTSTPLVCISLLRKLCNHPSLLHNVKASEEGLSSNSVSDYISSAFPPKYQVFPKDSGKMKVLENMLSSLFSQNSYKEKVVIVSSFTKMLDILENLCKMKNYEFLRLDGSTNTTSRQGIVDVFNCSYTKFRVFLLSSKAGGVGFNLIGASRIILYDIDWNPANDLQAMARIWRDGQKHEVYVYRLLTAGTIEEKIYQRQLSKQCLSGSVLDSNSTGKLRFSKEELMDLFTFHENIRCVTHDLINCKCLSLEYIFNIGEFENSDFSEKMKNAGMAELMSWTHVCGPISSDNCSDFCLVKGGSDITFLFQNTVNARRKS